MKIELCEDNGVLNGGTPTLVVLVITRDDGKQIRLPYEATKTIQELYIDANKMIEECSALTPYMKAKNDAFIRQVGSIASNVFSNEIQPEDIVKCVKKHPREEGADDDLTVGNEYRVIYVKKERGEIVHYDVLDDKADNRYRITVLPDEIELVRKREPKTVPVKKDYKQEIAKCVCGEENALDLKTETEDLLIFQGTCEKCGCAYQKHLEKNVQPVAG